jgi:hypothetical protein
MESIRAFNLGQETMYQRHSAGQTFTDNCDSFQQDMLLCTRHILRSHAECNGSAGRRRACSKALTAVSLLAVGRYVALSIFILSASCRVRKCTFPSLHVGDTYICTATSVRITGEHFMLNSKRHVCFCSAILMNSRSKAEKFGVGPRSDI